MRTVKALSLTNQKLITRLSFQKVSYLKSSVHKVKNVCTKKRSCNKEYQSSSTRCSKVNINVKLFKIRSRLEGHASSLVKHFGTHRKVMSYLMLM